MNEDNRNTNVSENVEEKKNSDEKTKSSIAPTELQASGGPSLSSLPEHQGTKTTDNEDDDASRSSKVGENQAERKETTTKETTTPATKAMISSPPSNEKPSTTDKDPSASKISNPENSDTLSGQVLAERYLIHQRVGEGGMGVVYKAEHIGLKKSVAIKVLLPELGAIDGVVKRFEREARSMSRLDHPGVVRVTDFGRTKDHLLFLVMEFVDGEPLGDLIIQEGRFNPGRAIHMIRQVLLALDHAHSLGVVHRDLKPDNIMVINPSSDLETTKILDFGIAKILEDSGDEKKPLTMAGAVFGTPEYLSPEQAAGEPADFRADLYTVGVILYELITGKRPFNAENRMQLINKHISEKPKPITHVLPINELPNDLDTVIMKSMAKAPDDRYQTAMDFFNALGSLPVEQRPLTFWPSPSHPAAPNPLTAKTKTAKEESSGKKIKYLIGIIAILAALVVGGIVYHFTGNEPKKSPEQEQKIREAKLEKKLLSGLDPKTKKKVRSARANISAIKPRSALEILLPLAKKREKNAYIHFLIGRAHMMRKNVEHGLKGYAKAVELEPELRKDRRLKEDIFALLKSKFRANRNGALRFLEESLKEESKDILIRSFKELDNYQVLREALLIAEKLGYGKDVDKNRFYELMLRDSPHCNERRAAVKQLMMSGDVDALPALRKALTRKPWYYNKRRRSNDCIKEDLENAIKQLEGLEKDKKPVKPPETSKSGDSTESTVSP